MSNTGKYVVREGKLIKISSRARLARSVIWPRHNDPRTNGLVIENLGHEPIHVSTKRQLRYEMDKRDVTQKDA